MVPPRALSRRRALCAAHQHPVDQAIADRLARPSKLHLDNQVVREYDNRTQEDVEGYLQDRIEVMRFRIRQLEEENARLRQELTK